MKTMFINAFLFFVTATVLIAIPKPNFFGMALLCAVASFLELPLVIRGKEKETKAVLWPLVVSLLAIAAGYFLGRLVYGAVHLSIDGVFFYTMSALVGYFIGIVAIVIKNEAKKEEEPLAAPPAAV